MRARTLARLRTLTVQLSGRMSTSSQLPPLTFPKSPIPPNPLGEGKKIKTAAALIIGRVATLHLVMLANEVYRDEILNGKTKDTNSNFFARYCFELGIEL